MIVWPNLIGPGWGEQLLLAAIMQGAIMAVLALVWRAAHCISAPRERDAVLALWRRYEQGDLTAQEFNRLRRTTPAAARPAGRASPEMRPLRREGAPG